MWNPVALDNSLCVVCSSNDGPFWIGPLVPTERLAPQGGLVKARLHICANCIFIAADGEDSPFAGRLRKFDTLDEDNRRLAERVLGMKQSLTAAESKVRLLDELLDAVRDRVAQEQTSPGARSKAA